MSKPDPVRSRLVGLRKAHTRAINAFDYQRAQEIQRQIDDLRGESRAGIGISGLCRSPRKLSHIDNQRNRAAQRLDEEILELQSRYKTRFLELDAHHAAERKALRTELHQSMNREKKRPIPEVNHLLLRSKVFGRDHQYEYAAQLVAEAQATHDRILNRRLDGCRATYREERRKLLEKQAHELALMNDRIDLALENIEGKYSFQEHLIDNHARINDFKMGVWPPAAYQLGPFHKTRVELAEEGASSPP
jgi:hypothetical protein